MSNTDGEDTQRIEGLNPGDKAYILTEEQYIKFERQNDVIADLKFKLKNDALFQEYSDLEKELASLREQLKEAYDEINAIECTRKMSVEVINKSQEQLKQQEEVIRELTDLLQRLIDGEKSFIKQYPRTSKNIESLLEKAKSLTTKDK